MAKEIERKGLPVAHITALTYIAQSVGTPRVVAGTAIQYPVGEPSKPLPQEKERRRSLLLTALHALASRLDKPTLFVTERPA